MVDMNSVVNEYQVERTVCPCALIGVDRGGCGAIHAMPVVAVLRVCGRMYEACDEYRQRNKRGASCEHLRGVRHGHAYI